MNSLTSRQRKVVYAIAIVVLLVPIIWLGAPLSADVQPGVRSQVDGGRLAVMRQEQQLGESTLGNIDPSSAAMNLVLLGLRGPASSLLHQNALKYQERKNWGKLKSTVDSIIMLQPHYVEVWKFQGWNLAFNVSREWDRVADRFYWVKEGMKFLQKGSERNQTATILFHNVGDFIGRKFGNSDEKKFFRRYFLADPDERYKGGPDPEINKEGKDNYLVAFDWFLRANELDETYPVKGMTREFFRKSPAQALFDYASAMTDEGQFDKSGKAWEDAYRQWTEVYGNERFKGLNDVVYKMNCTDEEMEALAEENGVTLAVQRKIWDQNLKMTNYRFWQQLSECEQDPETVAMRKALFNGKQEYALGNTSNSIDENGNEKISAAQEYFEEAIAGLASLFEKYPQMRVHDDNILDSMLAIHYWQDIHKLNGKTAPTEHPLADFAREHQAYQPEAILMFNREAN